MKKVFLVLISGVMLFSQSIVLAENLPVMYKNQITTLGPASNAPGDGNLPAPYVPRVPTEGAASTPREASDTTTLRVAPYQGYVDSMSHQVSVDTLNLGLKGKVTLYMTGVAMTEPAVLAGLQSANEFSNQQLDRSLKTYDLVTAAARDSGSVTSMQLLSELSACITKKATANKSHDVGLLVDVCLAKEPAAESEQIETPNRRKDADGAGINTLFVGN